jgi:MFS family permease
MEYWSVIRNRNFSRLWISQILSQTAQSLLNFALIIRVFELTQGTRFANLSVSLLVLSFGIPSVLLGILAGVYVDAWDRKKVMVIANLLRGVLVLGYLFFEHNLLVVLLLSFLISATSQFFIPAESASIPTLVGGGKVLTANSLFVFTLYASFIVGYSLSAPVINVFGPSGPYLATAIMFLAAAFLGQSLPKLRAPGRQLHWRQVVSHTRHELTSSFAVIRANHNLYFSLLQLTITQALIGVVLVLAPALSQALLKVPLQDASHILIIPAGLGMLLGVVLIGQLVHRASHLRIIAVGMLVAGLALTLLGFSGLLYRQIHGAAIANTKDVSLIVAMLILILGLMNALINISSQTLLQQHSTDQTRGKIFGALNSLINLAQVFPVLLAGALADLTSVTKVFAVIGILVVSFAVLQMAYLRTHRLDTPPDLAVTA